MPFEYILDDERLVPRKTRFWVGWVVARHARQGHSMNKGLEVGHS